MHVDSKKIAFLVVSWNNREIIDECIESIWAQSYGNKVIYVIDNASTDGTAKHIAKNHPDVILVSSSENNGFARGNNILIQKALEDENVGYIALINSDVVLDKKWSTEIINYIKHKPKAACVQGITLDYYDHGMIDAEHVYVGTNFQSVQYGYGERFKEAYSNPRKVFGVNAAAAVYTRQYIDEQPNNVFFDEKFYMYLEDVDISLRAIVTGWNNYYIPTARAYHMGSVSAKKRSNGYNLMMTLRNQSALLFKNLPIKTIIRFLPKAIKFDVHFFIHLRRTQGKRVAIKALRGRVEGLLRLPLYFKDRLRIRRIAKRGSAEIERVMRQKGIF